jgi:hypothetical protein
VIATSPVPLWAQEMSPHHRGPTAAAVVRLAILAVLVALVLQLAPTTDRGRATSPAGGVERGSLCQQHQGDPAWTAVCKEATDGR